jgi:hypothetical protein
MSPKLLRRYAVTLVHDLKADDVPGNAEDAIALLEQFRIAPPLEEALESSDWQQRQLAASVLRDLIWENPSIPVSDQLLQVTIEGLRSDDLPFGPSHTMWVLDARYGFNFLCQFPERIGPLIAPGLESDDPQQRLLCAAVAGFTHQATLTDHAAPILIEALLDNSTEGDAMVATPALARFGPGIAPYLIPYLDDPDPQRRELVHRILDSVGLTLRFDNLPVAGAPPPLHIAGVRRAAELTKNEPVEQWDRWFP